MEVTYVSHMGDDLQVVNVARVSFGKKSEWDTRLDHYNEDNDITKWEEDGWKLSQESSSGDIYTKLSSKDTSLIKFLARGCPTEDWEIYRETLRDCDGLTSDEELEGYMRELKNMPTHWTPFGHTAITLHIKAPIFVARQLGKHQVGMVWNEVSRRYITTEPEFYEPEVWRKAADNVKQGSSNEKVNFLRMQGFGEQTVHDGVFKHQMHSLDLYRDMLNAGVCPEQARIVLPQSMYTEWVWTGSLYSFANVFIQRTDAHAQKEVQYVAHQIGNIIKPLFPVSWKALTQ